MKATELRIGNWLKFGEMQHKATYHDIRNLYESELINKVPSGSYFPIPLTEEWLIKFGFAFESTCTYYVKNGIHLFYSNVEESKDRIILAVNTRNTIYIDYVHQLQNLFFALTGKELTL